MSSWREIEAAEPEFAGRVRSLFEGGRHKTIATVRNDGSPRISGIECEFVDGEIRFGSMDGSRKSADLKRDPRFALHGPTFHPEHGKEHEWPGEAKIAGQAVHLEIATGDEGDGIAFVADIHEVVVTGLNEQADKLVIQSWTPALGLRRVERATSCCQRGASWIDVIEPPSYSAAHARQRIANATSEAMA